MSNRAARRIRRPSCIAGAVLAMFASAPALAQADADLIRRLERQLRQLDISTRLTIDPDQPISERLLLDYGGSARFGFLAVDNSSGSTRILRQTEGIFSLRAELDGAHRFFGRLRLQYNDFNSGDSFDGDGDELREPIGDRYWYQFDLRGARLAETGETIDDNLNIKVGRQYVNWGSGLALSDALYAAVVDVELGDLGIRGLAGFTPSSGTIDFDGTRPDFDRDTDRQFYGGAVEWRGFDAHRPYVSFLAQRDDNDQNFAVISGIPTQFDYDSEYYAIGSRGTLGARATYRIEAIYQTGEAKSNSFNAAIAPITQTTEDIEAWAGVAAMSYLFRDEYDTRLDLEIGGATGDDDRRNATDTFGGNQTGTDDNAFNSLGYVDTGLALAPEITNLIYGKIGVSASTPRSPTRSSWLRAGVSAFVFAKADQDAPISVQTNSARFVGAELDFYVDWRVTSDVSATVRYGIFLPGSAMPADQDERHFLYAGVTYAF